MTIYLFLQREYTVGKSAGRNLTKRLGVDFHTAVHEIDFAEKLRFRAHRHHCRAEFRLTVVGQQHVLQQNGFFLRHTKLLRNCSDRLRTHDQVAQQLSLHRIPGGEPELGEDKLLPLGEVVQQRAGQNRPRSIISE